MSTKAKLKIETKSPASTKRGEVSKLLEGLNEAQRQAATHGEGPLLIVAGAGTGKTTVITRRVAYFIEQGTKPEEILALAFGERAAAEMEERVDELLPLGVVNIQVSTFHAFCEQVLHEYGIAIGLPDFKILDEVGQWLLIRNNLEKFDLQYYRPLGNPTKFIKALVKHFARAKDELVTPDEYLDYAEKLELENDQAESGMKHPVILSASEGSHHSDRDSSAAPQNDEVSRVEEVANAYHVYQKLLVENSALDFADLISYTIELFKKRPKILEHYRNRFEYILVDEFQDTNYAQYELLKLLAAPRNNITVVGDDDQSIFKFRGASISNILHFQRDYPKAKFISLTDNYRSKQNILDLAHSFIKQNDPDRLEVKLKLSKRLKSSRGGDGKIEAITADNYVLEAEAVVRKITELMSLSPQSWNDFAILARSHELLEPFIAELEKNRIPYIYFANRGLYHKPLILDLLSYFKVLLDYHDSQAFYRVLKLPVFAISDSAIVELSHHAHRKAASLYEAVRQKAIAKVLTTIEKHAHLAREKSALEVYTTVFNDLEFTKAIDLESQEGWQNARYNDAFLRRLQQFMVESRDRSLAAFMNEIAFEQEAGSEGELAFDPEAGPEAVKLLTVHGAKGLEFSDVFVVGLVDKRFPSIERKEQIELPVELVKDILPTGDIHLEEERRLFYVAMTRAKDGLYLTRALDYGGKQTKRPSRFLIELGLAEVEKAQPTGQVALKIPKRGRLQLPIPKNFSFSQISAFIACPLRYKYRYILRLPEPGNASLSFGQSVHKTLEKFLKHVQESVGRQDLFGKTAARPEPPGFALLQKYYEESWIDDWYPSKSIREEHHRLGLAALKIFYEEFKAAAPHVKYLEKKFRLKLRDVWFDGKIDRADQTDDGLIIIDYKTGAARQISDVDHDQLLSYQWAAQEFLKERVQSLQYWYLRDKLEKKEFLGTDEQIAKLQDKFYRNIQEIIACIKNNNFLEADLRRAHECAYRKLEL
ncbi:MAG: ATP-dependent helicase [Candidatus Doudnabacteria bacterium]|nr:ATP-dependent helicase [Candidatus Doudnabacteria bacterium]